MAHSTKRSSKAKSTTSSAGKKRPISSPSQSPTSSQCSPSTSHTFSSTSDEPAQKKHNPGHSNDYDDRSSRSTNQSTSRSPRIAVQRSVPAFLNKLYNMVEDETTNDLIRWSVDGASFTVEQHEEFAKSVLPRFYKHNTFASFVRQLNMYDFHKVPHPQQGILLADNDRELWEFSNPHFQRGRPNLLVRVTRKRNRDRDRDRTNRDRDTVEAEQVNLASLVKDITAIRKHQTTISSELHDLHRDNEILWQETLSAREKHQRHQDVIQKILQFLTTAFNSEQAPIDMSKHAQFMLGKHNEYIRIPQNKPLVQNIQSPMVNGSIISSERVVEGYSGMPKQNKIYIYIYIYTYIIIFNSLSITRLVHWL
ncbi:heat shock factor-type transcription factor [Phycomyces blakesleeanus NRRL 1555(-)]|uniref:Heat shock factor-type transcription factor n=1 Tax=Phycomyces blakesleeanus (strain ATCC 8743b / DSM 1359 / FGSC 10004 / NBRC 33097 / NRRL 1555) TaxID=763407 RepID=A0A162PXB6_PHYB8|nr:heat shock factor-type transcription factor [Phycomyces blakesleeanus NRRL 1555(-)]OAD75066.1 heat shock factor-type transcription factor [Phycomyces blakesleeanus NRRL 1555(-)]|eukprot:XP_018293106.1 heat shock factor-type transcription factor [Phycomyces blakesleeanus NRRL 1555(-)]